MAKQKLKLTWIGKDARSKLGPRIQPEKFFHATHGVADRNSFCNMSVSSYPAFLKSVVGLSDAGKS